MNILKDLLDIHEPKLCAIQIVSDSFSVGDYVLVFGLMLLMFFVGRYDASDPFDKRK